MKHLKKAYIGLVALLLVIPLALFPFVKGSSAEKRDLAAFPALWDETGLNTAFFTQLNTYLAERFPGRSMLISLNNAFKARVFATSDEEKIVVGREDWLYFAETLPDYTGEGRLSEGAIHRLTTTLSLMREGVEQAGGRFVFTIAPNKNTLYPEYMPAYSVVDLPSNLERISERLAQSGYYTDLSTLREQSTEQLYHKRDSHWNNLGAYYAFDRLMQTAGQAHTIPLGPVTWEKDWRGDLEDMIFPALSYMDHQATVYTDWHYTFTSRYHGPEDILITTENPAATGNLRMFRDSFGNALLPYLAESYATATFTRAVPYDLQGIAHGDTVMLEIVERNLPNLLSSAPVMPAPARGDVEGATACDPTTVRTESKGDLTHLYGALPTEAERVYLQLTNGTDTLLVEAFPLLEKSLADADPHAIGGFSAYIPAEYAEYTLTVFVEKEIA